MPNVIDAADAEDDPAVKSSASDATVQVSKPHEAWVHHVRPAEAIQVLQEFAVPSAK